LRLDNDLWWIEFDNGIYKDIYSIIFNENFSIEWRM
jgi:hypothetical protein